MADNKERLIVEADVSSVTAGAKTLDAFTSSAGKAGDSADKLGDKSKQAGEKAAVGATGQKKFTEEVDKTTKATEDATAATDKQGKTTAELGTKLDSTAKQLAVLALRQQQMNDAQKAGLIGKKYAEEYNAVLDKRRQILIGEKSAADAAALAEKNRSQSGEAAALAEAQRKLAQQAAEAEAALEREKVALAGLLDKIRPTRQGLRELQEQQESLAKAQNSGLLNAGEAAEYNAILNSRRQVIEKTDLAMRGLNVTGTKQKALQQGLTISTGQYRAAMGMLPAQMTDIVTQLAGGQNPFLIMIQQGGQIKDSFGGLGNTFSALKQYISPTFLGTAASIAAIAGIGYAAYETGERIKDMTRSVILMGGSGYSSVSQMNQAAKELSENLNEPLGNVVETLVTLNDKGKYTAKQMQDITKAVTLFSQAGGDSKEAMSGFDRLYDDPVKGLAKLNEQYGFVTEAQMKNVIQIKKSQGEYAATTEVINLWAGELSKRSQEVVEKTDGVSSAWRTMKTTASEIFDGIGVTIRAWSNEAIAGIQAVGAAFRVLLADGGVISEKLSVFLLEPLANLMEKIPGVGSSISKAMRDSIETSKANIIDYTKRGQDANADYQKYSELAMKSQAWHEQQVRNGDGVSSDTATDPNSRKKVSKLANDAGKKGSSSTHVAAGDKITEQYEAQALALQAQIDILENRKNFDQNASQQQKDYLLLQAKINVLEKIKADDKGRALTKDEKSLLANKDQVLAQAKIVAGYGDRLQKLQKEAQLSDELKKSQDEIASKVEVIRGTWGMTADETARAVENAQRAAALKAKGATDEQIKTDLKSRDEEKDATEDKKSDWVGGAKTALQEWGKAATDYSSIAKTAITGAMDSGLDSLNTFVTTGKLNFADFTKSVLSMIVSIINKLLIMKAIQAAGSAMGYDMSFMGGSTTKNANGGVYSSPSLSNFSNGVYDTPQNFTFSTPTAFAKGGVFGEAGPEAIMPLSRDSNGRLGVKAQGSSSSSGTQIGKIEVNVQEGQKASGSSSNSSSVGRAYAEAVTQGANDAIEKALQPGGKIWQAQNGHA